MELRQMVKILFRRWWLIVAPVLVVAAYAAAAYAHTHQAKVSSIWAIVSGKSNKLATKSKA